MQDDTTNPDSLIEEYLAAGHTGKAVELLYTLAISTAKNKDFLKAEAYRDRLDAIDSMALASIVEINKTIEAEKSNTMTPAFRQLWGPFLKNLSDEEANAFFFSLTKLTVESEKVVLTQGKSNNRIYLIWNGRLKEVYSDREKEFMIHSLGSGDYFGQDTFFSLNVCNLRHRGLP